MKLLVTTQVVDKNHPILGFFHRWIEEFAEYFQRIDIVCIEAGTYDLPEHVHVHVIGKQTGFRKWRYLLRFHILFSGAMKQNPNYVLYHMGDIFTVLGAPWFLRRRATEFYWWKTHGQIRMLGKIALRFVDRVYTAGEKSFPIQSSKRNVIGHAIDTSLFNSTDTPKTLDILYTGRFSRTKKIEYVVDTYARLQKSNNETTLKIVGAQSDPVYTKEICDRILSAGYDTKTIIVDPVEQKKLVSLYQSAKVFINPSEHDGLDKVILEAMAAGTVPITGNLAFEEMLSPYGLFVEKGDIDAFTEVAKKVLLMNTDEYNNLVVALRDIVVKHHSINTLTQRIFSL